MKLRYICSSLLILLAGCGSNSAPPAQNNTPAAAVESQSETPTAAPNTSAIERSEGVPNAVQSTFNLSVPRGFKVNLFAEGLSVPRRIVIAPGATAQKYDVFVSESAANRIRVLRETTGDGKADDKFIFASNLSQPYGLAFHPEGWLYQANTDAVQRFRYRNGQTKAAGKPEFIAKLTEGGYNQHWTRNLLFSRDAKKLYVSVGSSCNTCEEENPMRAAITEMNPDGSGNRLFATGLRNPVGMDWRPGTQELWTVVNERDNVGDDVPPDYLTQVRDGAFYGWPYAYTTIDGRVTADPSFGDKSPQKVKETRPPTVPVQAHSAVLGVGFYPDIPLNQVATTGTKYFPAEFRGDAFLAYHGSWNRSSPTGYKIVRVNFENGKPVSLTDFVTGFLSNRNVKGRPVDVTVAPDGSLLFSDDGAGKIWRVSYSG